MIESGVALKVVDHPDHTLPPVIAGATPIDCTVVGAAPTTPGDLEGKLWTVQTPAGRVVVHEDQLARRGEDCYARAEPAVVVIEMPPAAPRTPIAVKRAAGYLMREQKCYQSVANADVVVGRWGVERGDADGDDLGGTILVVGKDRLCRSEGLVLDGTRIDLDLFSAAG